MTSQIMKITVGASLVVFLLALSTIILFGFTNILGGFPVAIFKTIFFVLLMILLGAVYIFNADNLSTKWEHALIIFSIIMLSAAVATLAGNIKSVNDIRNDASQDQIVSQNNYYSQYARSMRTQAESLETNNRILESEIEKLTQKINNRTPIIVETVVTIPGKVIYVEERAPRREREEEDDD